MHALAVGIISAIATITAAAIGGLVLWLTNRSTNKRAEESERRRDDAERRAAEAERLNEELGRWTNITDALQKDIARLNQELAGERDRAARLQERLDAKTRDLQVAEREIERLKARLGEL